MNPPTNDGQKRCVRRLQSRYAAHAAIAGAVAKITLRDPSGPISAVMGHANSAGPGMKADHVSSTPLGRKMYGSCSGLR